MPLREEEEYGFAIASAGQRPSWTPSGDTRASLRDDADRLGISQAEDAVVVAAGTGPPETAIAPFATLGSTDPPWQLLDLHHDHLGSTRLVTGDNGAISSQHDFLPFGEEIAPVQGLATKKFTGHERGRSSHLDYMLARYYGVNTPRFLSSDPVEGTPDDTQSWNLYTYVRNNPVKLVDPLGLHWAPGTEPPDLPSGPFDWGKPPGVPCIMCVRVDPASGSEKDKKKAEQYEQDAWTFYQANQAQLEEVYGAWGVSRRKVKRWFTPGKGPRVQAVDNLTLNGKKVRGLYWGRRSGKAEIEIDNNLGGNVVGSLIHELVHKTQRDHGDTPEGAFGSDSDALIYAATRVKQSIQAGYNINPRKEFMAFWATRVLFPGP